MSASENVEEDAAKQTNQTTDSMVPTVTSLISESSAPTQSALSASKESEHGESHASGRRLSRGRRADHSRRGTSRSRTRSRDRRSTHSRSRSRSRGRRKRHRRDDSDEFDDRSYYYVESTALSTHHSRDNKALLTLKTPSALANGRMLCVRLLLDAKRVGSVIGRGGNVISDIREKSEAKIVIARSSVMALQRLCSVEGRFDRVTHAVQLISDKQAEVESTSLSIDESLMESMTLLIDESMAGVIIGKSGRTVSDIRSATRANVYVSTNCLMHASEKSIDVCGTREQVHSALAFIILKLAESPKSSTPRIAYDPNLPSSTGSGAEESIREFGTRTLSSPLPPTATHSPFPAAMLTSAHPFAPWPMYSATAAQLGADVWIRPCPLFPLEGAPTMFATSSSPPITISTSPSSAALSSGTKSSSAGRGSASAPPRGLGQTLLPVHLEQNQTPRVAERGKQDAAAGLRGDSTATTSRKVSVTTVSPTARATMERGVYAFPSMSPVPPSLFTATALRRGPAPVIFATSPVPVSAFATTRAAVGWHRAAAAMARHPYNDHRTEAPETGAHPSLCGGQLFSTRSETAKDGDLVVTLKIMDSAIGCLIGRGGTEIKHLRNRCRAAKITISNDSQLERVPNTTTRVSTRQVTIKGAETTVHRALELIHIKLSTSG